MTQQEAIDDILARLRHALTQRDRAAREWERQASEWEAQCRTHRATIDQLQFERGVLCDELSADSATVAGQTLVEAIRELRASATLAVERCKGLEAQKRALLARIAQLEGTEP